LGHAYIKTTFNTYGHLMPKAKKEATAKLQKALFGSKTKPIGTQTVMAEGNEKVN
jgi:hypothetical protein